ncbi:hypothetical protein [Actinomadura rugatobispora]|uniref:CopG family transcriptional regulator n=1 Tax=Actinomadura rugatobispora TaxID=1994 RepID=A0ABW1A332_9ACTN|nr:hypothetical protein GCM10010200_028960 [Actinomadura rugatobispora]
MDDQKLPPAKTPTRPIRVPIPMWEAYGRVCARLGTDRTPDLLDHMRERIQQHGDAQDLADLESAEQELAERRSRKGGRPRRT